MKASEKVQQDTVEGGWCGKEKEDQPTAPYEEETRTPHICRRQFTACNVVVNRMVWSCKENIAPFNTGKWRLSDSVGQKDSAILKNGFFLGDTPQAAVVKSYIIGYGSVVMAYHAPEETWEETAYYGKNHEAYNCNSARQTANHIVAIVGWDDSYSRDNFNSGSRPSRDGAWIVKNS